MDETWVTLGVILSGVAIVVGSVLWLRLHAFLALVLGALVVALLTPTSAVEQFHIKEAAAKIANVNAAEKKLTLHGDAPPGKLFRVVRITTGSKAIDVVAEVVVDRVEDREVTVTDSEDLAAVRPGDRLITPAAFQEAAIASKKNIGARVAQGFGNTCVKIGILIAMAAIIGKCLLDSGAADRIVRTALRTFGERAAPLAFMTSGFTLGIPVFFDTVFYLMIPLGKAMGMRTGRNYLLYVLTIVCGASMAHSLVPPTPGPLFVAEELGVDLGTMMLAGCIIGLFSATTGYLYAMLANRLWTLPLRESPDFSLEDLKRSSELDESLLPPLWLSLLPILLPVVLIAGQTILDKGFFGITAPPAVLHAAATLGDKSIALTIAAAVSMATLVWQKRTSREELSDSIQDALASGGVIILITAAGGAFGAVLRQTNVAGLIQDLPQSSPAMICVLAFLITTAIRTAQGSATVAMITAVGILSGLARGGELGFHPVYLALSIGCGSKPLAWMNDSGFWVITRMSGMTETEGLKFVTPMTALMGLVGLGAVIVGVTFFPMV